MKKTVIVLGLLFAAGIGLCAAENAVQFWQIFALDWKPAPGLTLEFEKQLRYEDTLVALESDISELGIKYKLQDWLSVATSYRFVALGDEKRNRFDGSLVLSWRGAGVQVANRARLQKEFINTRADSWSELVFRDRLRLTFLPDRKLRPFAGGEIFIGLDEAGKSENKFRLSSGLEFDLNQRVELSLFYHYQHDLGEKTNETFHIIAGRFCYTF
jgi:hypothetical protein